MLVTFGRERHVMRQLRLRSLRVISPLRLVIVGATA
jgi:hypothetical protein